MKKQYLSVVPIILTICILITLTGCGGSSGTEKPQNNVPGGSAAAEESDSVQEDISANFEKVVLVDNEYCKVTIEGLEKRPYSEWEYRLKVHFENKTDFSLGWGIGNISVNGIMESSSFWSYGVPAGLKDNQEVIINTMNIEKLVELQPSFIEFQLDVFDQGGNLEDYIVHDHFSFGTPGKEVSINTNNMQVVFENDEFAMYIAEYWASFHTLLVYLENRSDRQLVFSETEAIVNDSIDLPAYWESTVDARKKAVSQLNFLDPTHESLFKDNDIEIESITLPDIRVETYNDNNSQDSYFTRECIFNASFTFTP